MASPLGTLMEVASLTPSGYEPMLTVVVWPRVLRLMVRSTPNLPQVQPSD